MAQEGAYSPAMAEEELKSRVAADWFGGFDCARIMGRVDFCVALPATDLPLCDAQSLLWAEAKKGRRDPVESLVQLILTIGRERTFDKFLPPRFLGAFDAEKIAFLPYEAVMEVFYKNDFNWEVAPSDHATREFRELRALVADDVERRLVVFYYATDGRDLSAFIRRNFTLGADGSLRQIQITKNNFTHIYQKWREAVLPSIAFSDWEAAKKGGILDADFFLADILSKDNAALMPKLNVLLKSDHYRRASGQDFLGLSLFADIGFNDGQKAHAQFWNRYRRPPRREYWSYIVERRDLLVPQDVREVKGAFFTPRRWVELSQHYLELELGADWQDEYVVWDCCAGTGNLLAGLTNKYNVWASTLDRQDVDVMRQRIAAGANLLESHVFQFDFLNDSFDKLPPGLREIVADPSRRRRLVIYINPPYAEAGDIRQRSGTGKNKTDVSVVHATYSRYLDKIGIAGRELFAQFFMRINDEIPGCILAEFSKLKHLQSPNFAAFRQCFRAQLGRAFIVPADTFDNVKGKFPIGFFVWRLGGSQFTATEKEKEADAMNCVPPVFTEAELDVYDAKGRWTGTKTILSYDGMANIGKWVSSFRHDDGLRLGFMSNGRNDFQNQNLVYFINDRSQLSTPRGWWITPYNLVPMCIFVAVRHSIEATWLNDRDQFLWPNDGWKGDAVFQADCLVYALFSDFNVIRSADGVNHWIPFTEAEVGARDNFASHFMSDWLAGRVASTKRPQAPDSAAALSKQPYQGELFAGAGGSQFTATGTTDAINCVPPGADALNCVTPAARAVLDAGRGLWRYYHARPDANPNASYYDIRLCFQGTTTDARGKAKMNSDSPDATYTRLLAALRAAHRALAARIAPKVYAYGFLKN